MVFLYFDSQFRVPLANLEQRSGGQVVSQCSVNRVKINAKRLECADEFFGQSVVSRDRCAQLKSKILGCSGI
jgi:hypothetical protein